MATPTTTATKRPTWKSRAVRRLVEPGNWAECSCCEKAIKFRARERLQQVICNVYIDGKWDRVEHFHDECYDEAGAPYGEPAE
ncbi:MAG: hypothetical protein KDB21_07075 [Acidimicrobiales bacterium]|nr:hypothetical protein [Acidimicrobiales bacterium]